MNNILIPVLLSVLLLVSGCDGRSGVKLPSADVPGVPDELPGNDDTGASDGGDGGDGGDGPVLPVDDDTPQALPPSPQNLRVSRYSDTTAELFWDEPEGLTGDTHEYRVSLDGNELDRISSLSYFTEGLQAGNAYQVSVSTVDQDDLISVPASIQINAEVDIPPPVYDFALSLEHSEVVLNEGEDSGSRVTITVDPQGDEAVEVVIQGQSPSDSAGLVIDLNRQVLEDEQLSAVLTIHLPVGMRPIQPHTRRLNIVASSGDEIRTAELILEVKPVAAPDVYLLIGQSNMVGSSELGAKDVSPGGLDQRDGRIWQLNVAPNNASIFSDFEEFQDESSTVIEPYFIEAEDPVHDPRYSHVDFKGGTMIGPSLSFAKAALVDTTQKIYLVPAAWGASGFCRVGNEERAWNADDSDNASLGGTGLLERALTRLRMTLRETGGVLRGILWHQGGADSNNQACADAYAENLKLMVERLRREAPLDRRGEAARGSQAPIPFIAATQSRGEDERGDYSRWSPRKAKVDAVHRNIASLLPYADWVNNDDLVPPAYPCGSSSCVHFGAAASRETGERFYEALIRIWSR